MLLLVLFILAAENVYLAKNEKVESHDLIDSTDFKNAIAKELLKKKLLNLESARQQDSLAQFLRKGDKNLARGKPNFKLDDDPSRKQAQMANSFIASSNLLFGTKSQRRACIATNKPTNKEAVLDMQSLRHSSSGYNEEGVDFPSSKDVANSSLRKRSPKRGMQDPISCYLTEPKKITCMHRDVIYKIQLPSSDVADDEIGRIVESIYRAVEGNRVPIGKGTTEDSYKTKRASDDYIKSLFLNNLLLGSHPKTALVPTYNGNNAIYLPLIIPVSQSAAKAPLSYYPGLLLDPKLQMPYNLSINGGTDALSDIGAIGRNVLVDNGYGQYILPEGYFVSASNLHQRSENNLTTDEEKRRNWLALMATNGYVPVDNGINDKLANSAQPHLVDSIQSLSEAKETLGSNTKLTIADTGEYLDKLFNQRQERDTYYLRRQLRKNPNQFVNNAERPANLERCRGKKPQTLSNNIQNLEEPSGEVKALGSLCPCPCPPKPSCHTIKCTTKTRCTTRSTTTCTTTCSTNSCSRSTTCQPPLPSRDPKPCPTTYSTPCPTTCPTISTTPCPTTFTTPCPTTFPTPYPTISTTPCPTTFTTPCPTTCTTPSPTTYTTPCPTTYTTPCPTTYTTPYPTTTTTPCPTTCSITCPTRCSKHCTTIFPMQCTPACPTTPCAECDALVAANEAFNAARGYRPMNSVKNLLMIQHGNTRFQYNSAAYSPSIQNQPQYPHFPQSAGTNTKESQKCGVYCKNVSHSQKDSVLTTNSSEAMDLKSKTHRDSFFARLRSKFHKGVLTNGSGGSNNLLENQIQNKLHPIIRFNQGPPGQVRHVSNQLPITANAMKHAAPSSLTSPQLLQMPPNQTRSIFHISQPNQPNQPIIPITSPQPPSNHTQPPRYPSHPPGSQPQQHGGQYQPQSSQHQPQWSQPQQHGGQYQPQGRQPQPQGSQPQPQGSQPQPQGSPPQPQWIPAQPQGIPPQPQGSPPQPQGIPPQSQGIPPQPQGSPPQPQGSPPQPQGSPPQPQGGPPQPPWCQPYPLETQPLPSGNQPQPQGSSPPPQGSSPQPQGSPPQPQENPPQPQSWQLQPSACPQSSTIKQCAKSINLPNQISNMIPLTPGFEGIQGLKSQLCSPSQSIFYHRMQPQREDGKSKAQTDQFTDQVQPRSQAVSKLQNQKWQHFPGGEDPRWLPPNQINQVPLWNQGQSFYQPSLHLPQMYPKQGLYATHFRIQPNIPSQSLAEHLNEIGQIFPQTIESSKHNARLPRTSFKWGKRHKPIEKTGKVQTVNPQESRGPRKIKWPLKHNSIYETIARVRRYLQNRESKKRLKL